MHIILLEGTTQCLAILVCIHYTVGSTDYRLIPLFNVIIIWHSQCKVKTENFLLS